MLKSDRVGIINAYVFLKNGIIYKELVRSGMVKMLEKTFKYKNIFGKGELSWQKNG